MTTSRSCHHLIKKTAQEMAGAIYEEIMSDNKRWEAWKITCKGLSPKAVQQRFIAMMWPHLVEQARKTLAECLASPGLPEAAKVEIHEALILDNDLKFRTRGGGQPSRMWRQ